jgi:hypothetical protein
MKNERMFHLWGWILFLLCACFFMVAAIESRDIPGIIGSGVFIAACFLFLIPLIKKSKTD